MSQTLPIFLPKPATPVDVMFRVSPAINETPSEILAIFPGLPGTNDPRTCACYAHVGQHGICELAYIKHRRLATPAEYADLLKELTAIGYAVTVVSRATKKHARMRDAHGTGYGKGTRLAAVKAIETRCTRLRCEGIQL